MTSVLEPKAWVGVAIEGSFRPLGPMPQTPLVAGLVRARIRPPERDGRDRHVESAAAGQVNPRLDVVTVRGEDLAEDPRRRHDDQDVGQVIPRTQRALRADAPRQQTTGLGPIGRRRDQKPLGVGCPAHEPIHQAGFLW